MAGKEVTEQDKQVITAAVLYPMAAKAVEADESLLAEMRMGRVWTGEGGWTRVLKDELGKAERLVHREVVRRGIRIKQTGTGVYDCLVRGQQFEMRFDAATMKDRVTEIVERLMRQNFQETAKEPPAQ